MMAATDRLEFAPPPTPGLMRSFGLAVVAHALLLAALTLGVQWKRDAVEITAEAELWSALPQQAAPRLIETAPVAPPSPPPVSPAAPARPAPEPPRPPVAQPDPPEVDIALQREKLRLKKLKEQEKQELEKRQLEKQRLDKLKQDKLKQDKLQAEQKKVQDKRDQDKAVAEAKKKVELETKRKEALNALEETKQLEAQRQANLQRMAGLAGASGAPASTGTAQKSSGPSAGYAGRIRASIKPNIVFTEDISDNPVAEVEVRTSPDGTIISRKLTTSSGVKSWDEAVLKAIDRTGKLPKDVDGRVPPSLEIRFRPRD